MVLFASDPTLRSPPQQDHAAASPVDGHGQEQEQAAAASGLDSEPEPSASQVTMVEVTLLGDLVRILDNVKTQQRLRLEEERLANANRAVRVQAQEESARQQAALAEQQKLATAAAIRGELRVFNHVSSYWKPLPLMNGEPLPADVRPVPDGRLAAQADDRNGRPTPRRVVWSRRRAQQLGGHEG
ncbi:hypothetical protein LXA43DRAFT_1182958 [Ganoderma leucocontextum]|nr:hypothetical protein LXA43DRAFT_1182958 [Ganoderma leucocontextum]